MKQQETITAISTGKGGAIGIIRISGEKAIDITDKFFSGISGKKLSSVRPFSICYGYFNDLSGKRIDDVLVSVFHNPHSYTGEDMIEISCHGSSYIQQQILTQLIAGGARMAEAGEFTLRAYLNGKMDIVQAEAVADLIAAESAASHRLAVNQMRGGYSKEFAELREQLLNFVSLLELELDFGEEDVEFADRTRIRQLLCDIREKVSRLVQSFRQGNVIKNGVPVAIVGAPNSGKSTLLNALLNEERAIVSDIAGTTRDVIEETIHLGGVLFRFIDTAGIRHTTDKLENLGIERTFDRLNKAHIIFLLLDGGMPEKEITAQISQIKKEDYQKLIIIINKSDLYAHEKLSKQKNFIATFHPDAIFIISARCHTGIDIIEKYLTDEYAVNLSSENVIISNTRHYDLLSHALTSIDRALNGIDTNLPTDLISQDIRETLHHLGSLTGEITNQNILSNIFANFCIGK